MFTEHGDVIAQLKQENAHFGKIFDKHNALNDQIVELEKDFVDQFEVEAKKKEKLRLKDEVYTMILDYKRANAL